VIEYIRSKRRLVPVLGDLLAAGGAKTALDMFAGRTRVAQEFKRRGAVVAAVDSARYSEVFAQCDVATDRDTLNNCDLTDASQRLNALPGSPGYFTDTFCVNPLPPAIQRRAHRLDSKLPRSRLSRHAAFPDPADEPHRGCRSRRLYDRRAHGVREEPPIGTLSASAWALALRAIPSSSMPSERSRWVTRSNRAVAHRAKNACACLKRRWRGSPATRAKKHAVVEGTDNAFKWAKKYNVKLAWGTDLMFVPAQMKNQNTDIVQFKAWMTPAEALRLVTHDNAQLLALSGLRNPYPGKQGVVEVDALADLLLVATPAGPPATPPAAPAAAPKVGFALPASVAGVLPCANCRALRGVHAGAVRFVQTRAPGSVILTPAPPGAWEASCRASSTSEARFSPRSRA
jgi:hypothetical protein